MDLFSNSELSSIVAELYSAIGIFKVGRTCGIPQLVKYKSEDIKVKRRKITIEIFLDITIRLQIKYYTLTFLYFFNKDSISKPSFTSTNS